MEGPFSGPAQQKVWGAGASVQGPERSCKARQASALFNAPRYRMMRKVLLQRASAHALPHDYSAMQDVWFPPAWNDREHSVLKTHMLGPIQENAMCDLSSFKVYCDAIMMPGGSVRMTRYRRVCTIDPERASSHADQIVTCLQNDCLTFAENKVENCTINNLVNLQSKVYNTPSCFK